MIHRKLFVECHQIYMRHSIISNCISHLDPSIALPESFHSQTLFLPLARPSPLASPPGWPYFQSTRQNLKTFLKSHSSLPSFWYFLYLATTWPQSFSPPLLGHFRGRTHLCCRWLCSWLSGLPRLLIFECRNRKCALFEQFRRENSCILLLLFS